MNAAAALPASISTLTSSIKSCIPQEDLRLGKALHAHITKSGFLADTSLSNQLLNLYSKLSSSIANARNLFDEMPNRDLVSFATFIAANARSAGDHSSCTLALTFVARLRRLRLEPNQFVFSSAITACSKLGQMVFGKQTHAQVIVSGFEHDPFVKAGLVDMYSKFGELGSAISAFSCGPVGDPVMVNSMLSGYVTSDCYTEALELFGEARRHFSFKPTEPSFITLLRACEYLGEKVGESVHGFMVKIGLDLNCFVATSLIDMYGRFSNTGSMEMVFQFVASVDLAMYNSLLVGFSQNGVNELSLRYFMELTRKGYSANECTLSSVLKACGGLKSLSTGSILHGFVEKSKFRQNLVVSTALIDMYMKCGMVDHALLIFYCMERRNTILYNSVISGLGLNGMPDEALGLFIEMNRQYLESDLATFLSLLGLSSGQEWIVFVHAIKQGFGQHQMLENALLDGLFKSGASEDAFKFFEKMKEKNVMSWTSAITGLVQLGFHSKAIDMFKMMKSSTVPNEFTFSSAFKACGSSANLLQGKCIHGCSIRHGVVDNEFTKDSLLDMYLKCGALDDSHRLFDEMPKTNIISWNIMISGYAQHGYGHKALQKYHMMELYGIEPTHSTFVSLLSACSHSGLVDDGVRLFKLMVLKHNITPLSEHYACMVDIFGRVGLLTRAKCFIEDMPVFADSSIWAVFLSACKLHGNVELAQLAEGQVMGRAGKDTPTFVLMSNMFSGAGRWNDAEKMRKNISAGGLNKEPGVSWVQVIDEPFQSISRISQSSLQQEGNVVVGTCWN